MRDKGKSKPWKKINHIVIFYATYNVCNTKKRIFMLHTTYETPKREFSCYIQRMKHQKENLTSNYKLQKSKNNKK